MILDTNALTAFVDGEPGAVDQMARASLVVIPVIVLGEYRYGIAQSRLRAEYERWLEKHLSAFRILDVTEDTAARYAEVRLELRQAGTPLPVNDTWIAALCRQHKLPILSRDEHFDWVKGVQRLVW